MLTPMSDLVELTIEQPAFGGAGLARLEGAVWFVEGGLPGSKVMARAIKRDRNCVRAVAEQVIEPSPQAAEPFCPHFGVCGGCTWQDAAYEAQLEWKRAIVAEQLARLGGLDVPVEPAVASPLARFYRNKMEFSFGQGQDYSLVLGLRERHRPGRVLDVRSCMLMPEPAMAILDAVREVTAALSLPPYFARTGTGVWRHLVLRRSEATGRWLAQLIVGPTTPFKRLKSLGEKLRVRFDELDGVVLDVRKDKGDFAIGEKRVWADGAEHLTEELDGLRFRVSADAFFQTNTQAAALLYAQAVDAARLSGTQSVWDLYSGAGGLSLFLARQAGRVAGYEASEPAVEDARHNAQANGLDNCTFTAGDVKSVVSRAKSAPDVAVMDPPRAGLHPDTADALIRLAPPRMVYVSCNPSTLARDLGRLSAAYAVERVTPVDLFPHTPHIECVAALARKD